MTQTEASYQRARAEAPTAPDFNPMAVRSGPRSLPVAWDA